MAVTAILTTLVHHAIEDTIQPWATNLASLRVPATNPTRAEISKNPVLLKDRIDFPELSKIVLGFSHFSHTWQIRNPEYDPAHLCVISANSKFQIVSQDLQFTKLYYEFPKPL